MRLLLQQDRENDASDQMQGVSRSSVPFLGTVWKAVSWPTAAVGRQWRQFNDHLASDQSFADAISRKLDIWAAILLFSTYTLTAILIFAINGTKYGNA